MRDVILFLFFFHAASTNMQHGLPGSFIRSGYLALSRVKFKLTFLGPFFDASRREKYDGVRHLSLSLLVEVICRNVDITIKQLFSLICQGNVKFWPKVVKPGMVVFKIARPDSSVGRALGARF